MEISPFSNDFVTCRVVGGGIGYGSAAESLPPRVDDPSAVYSNL
jgi:hypothetical protein